VRPAIFAIATANLMLSVSAQADTTTDDAAISTEVNGYRTLLRGEVGRWLSSCRYKTPKPFGPFMESIDWGDGSISLPADFDHVSCGNIARHFYREPGEYEVVLTRTSIRGADDDRVFSERLTTIATVLPEISVEVAKDRTVWIRGQIGEVLASCDYPRTGRGYWRVSIDWGDGQLSSSCPDTLSHRYEKPGHYTIMIGVTMPGETDGPVLLETSIDADVTE